MNSEPSVVSDQQNHAMDSMKDETIDEMQMETVSHKIVITQPRILQQSLITRYFGGNAKCVSIDTDEIVRQIVNEVSNEPATLPTMLKRTQRLHPRKLGAEPLTLMLINHKEELRKKQMHKKVRYKYKLRSRPPTRG